MASIYRKKSGDIWYYSITYQSKRYQGTTKTTDKKSAQLIAESIQTDLARQKYDLPGLNNNKNIFDSIFQQDYLKNLTSSKSTINRTIVASKNFLPLFNNKQINNIKQIDTEEYQRNRKIEIANYPKNQQKGGSEISYHSVNLEIAVLHHFFNYCIKKELIDKNPCTGIKKLNELSRIKTLSDEDINKLINGATNKLTKDLISFLIYTGCRKGEALNLKWDNVDLNNGVIAIKGTKTKYDRYIPIHNQLKELLTGIEKKDGCEYLFNDNGKRLGDFKRSFHTACRNAGLKDMHIHDLRHVFASKMVMGGTSLYITGELLGHRTTQMTKRYSHLVPETLKKAVDDVWN
ncbi:MAG: tyrosine-type recombinase/integrase [bacterium]